MRAPKLAGILPALTLGCAAPPLEERLALSQRCWQTGSIVDEPMADARRDAARDSIDACRALLRSEPTPGDAARSLESLGTLLQYVGDWEASRTPLTRAVALRPSWADARARLARSHLVEGYAHEARRERREARKSFEMAAAELRAALEMQSTLPNVQWELGLAPWELNETGESIEQLRAAVETHPTEQHSVHLAALLNSLERYDESVSILEKAKSFAPDILENNRVARDIWESSRRRDRWESGLELTP